MVNVKRGLIMTIASLMLVNSFAFGANARYIEEVLSGYDHEIRYSIPHNLEWDDNQTYKNITIPTGYVYTRLADTVYDKENAFESTFMRIIHHTCNYRIYRM